ncbi:Rz-like spanin [Vibrio phage CP-T1]|uniref:Rz-like spanin n=1 Tax=Vibrio phage CP-T1 TaxID=10689 RepID=UPI0002536CDD|nr:Rz-like spanin [Vibrio phage CP-T1]AFC22418.1 hypothetical protein CP-T1_0036 [Vibrio phage CP-T1]AIA08728.1 hypothetical protein SBVc24_0039 [Vibrio phage 24]
MRKLLLVALVALLTACSSMSDFEEQAVNMSRIDTVYCDAVGFKSFQDLGAYWSFVCKDGRKFIVRYKN